MPEPRIPRDEVRAKVDETLDADRDLDRREANIESEIRDFRARSGLPLDELLIEGWAADYREGRPLPDWWMTPEETAAARIATKRYEEAAEHARPYIESHDRDYAGDWIEHERGGEYHVAFVRDVDVHRRALKSLVPDPEAIHVHSAPQSERERQELVDRIHADEDDLAAQGVRVFEVLQ